MASVEENTQSGLAGLLRGGVSRRSLLQRSAVTAAAVVPLGILAACGSSTNAATSPTATKGATFAGLKAVSDNKTAFTEIMTDENQHVQFLMSALGTSARPKPTFKGLEQTDIMTFANVSRVLENTGVGAYLMAAPAISNKQYLSAAGSILTIEARHAGFLDVLLGQPISADGPMDKPLTQPAVVAAASPFIASLNNGSDPAATLGSDTDILNFALLLEFLEAEFYNVNVPKFFP